MRFRVRFQDPNRTTENLIECDTVDEAHLAHNAIRRYAVYLGTVNLPNCTIEYRPDGVYQEKDWKPLPKGKTSYTAKEAADEFLKGLMSEFN